eukprot:scaffold22602_cov154-Cylindrotheca_fusiformis.AAC.9
MRGAASGCPIRFEIYTRSFPRRMHWYGPVAVEWGTAHQQCTLLTEPWHLLGVHPEINSTKLYNWINSLSLLNNSNILLKHPTNI